MSQANKTSDPPIVALPVLPPAAHSLAKPPLLQHMMLSSKRSLFGLFAVSIAGAAAVPLLTVSRPASTAEAEPASAPPPRAVLQDSFPEVPSAAITTLPLASDQFLGISAVPSLAEMMGEPVATPVVAKKASPSYAAPKTAALIPAEEAYVAKAGAKPSGSSVPGNPASGEGIIILGDASADPAPVVATDAAQQDLRATSGAAVKSKSKSRSKAKDEVQPQHASAPAWQPPDQLATGSTSAEAGKPVLASALPGAEKPAAGPKAESANPFGDITRLLAEKLASGSATVEPAPAPAPTASAGMVPAPVGGAGVMPVSTASAGATPVAAAGTAAIAALSPSPSAAPAPGPVPSPSAAPAPGPVASATPTATVEVGNPASTAALAAKPVADTASMAGAKPAADGPVAQSVPLGMAGLASRSASSPASKLANTQASPAASLPSPMAVVASQASKAAAASSLAPTAPWDAESIPLLTEQIMPLAPALHVEAAPAAFKSIVNVQDGQAQGASAVADFPTLPVTGVESDGEPAASMPTPQADEVIIVAASGVQRVVNDSTTTLALQAESRQAPQGDVLVVSTQGAQTLSDAMDDTLDLRSIMRTARSDSASSEASYAMAQVPQLPAWVVMDPETRRLVPQRLAPR